MRWRRRGGHDRLRLLGLVPADRRVGLHGHGGGDLGLFSFWDSSKTVTPDELFATEDPTNQPRPLFLVGEAVAKEMLRLDVEPWPGLMVYFLDRDPMSFEDWRSSSGADLPK